MVERSTRKLFDAGAPAFVSGSGGYDHARVIVPPALQQHAVDVANGRLQAAYVPPHAALAFVGELRVPGLASPLAAMLSVDEMVGRVDSVRLYRETAGRWWPVPAWVDEAVTATSQIAVDAYLASEQGMVLLCHQLGVALAEVDEVMAHGLDGPYLRKQRAAVLRLLIRHSIVDPVVLTEADRIAEGWKGSLSELAEEAGRSTP